ncbi:TonB-dependent receptor [Panacibacter ginsenosidivorans]|uniref:TonB-dependent receptor n=1 Tax=Panacibacter ginsenosidivorans TaxID=1813871 RepID=A0A5B8VG52_9BACT|nr:TonB-dependent receptor [Panacibacter ginsenosidivorans]QEC70015.1 TonB-dependent receptor [Panacibacter ginsenosidivorans]
MKKIYLFIVPAFIATTSFAQTIGKISGSIISSDKKVIEAATISLLKAKDSSLIKMEVTDKNGLFEFEHVNNGNYLLSADAVGYQKSYTSIVVSDDKKLVNADFVMSNASASLAGVSVKSTRPLIENKIDKTIVNVEASPTNTGLSALEVLEKSPGITVNNDGEISLKGKQGVKIFIDGKPSYLSGQDLTNYLKNLSSNQLDQIEIMTQPSAKYDAAGNTGIINIKTKKNVNNGLNGSFSTSAIIAKYFKNTNNINFNWRKGKTNIYGMYGNSYWLGFNDIYINRSLREGRDSAFNRYSEQHTYGKYKGLPHNFKLGADYFAGKNTTVGVAMTSYLDNDRFTSTGTANIYDSLHRFVQYNDANSETHDPWTNVGFNVNLQQKLDTSGKELSVDADYILYRTKGKQYSNNYLYNSDGDLSEDPFLLNGYLPANIDIYSFKADYKQPLKKNATLEAGVKFSYVKTDNDAQYTIYDAGTGKWENDETRSNHFIYKENINAAYINLQKQIKKFGIQLGLRAEQTIAEGNQVSKEIAFKKNYTKLFPTTYFSYNLNDNNTFGLSYGRRIERPGYQDLNPFQYQLDRYTYRQGNPDLQPQFSHNFELSYNYKGALNISANYTTVSDIINDVLITKREPGDSNYTTYQTKQNIASNKNIGLAVSYNTKLAKWWSINVFANVFNNHYKGTIDGEQIDLGLTSYTANMSSQFTFNKGWSAEASGFYRGKNLESSAILSLPMGMFSVGGGKKILKDKGSIRLNLRDPFYLMSFRGSTDLNKGYTQIHSYWDNRRAIISFTYRFGKVNNPAPRRHNTGADDEKSRVNTGGQQ